MDLTGDELAGVVDLFGALTRAELAAAVSELAFKHRAEVDESTVEALVDDAVDSYHLVEFAGDDGPTNESLLAPGPVALPTLPEGADDLPHILDVDERSVDRERVGEAVERRFRAETAAALDAGNDDRVATLLGVSYELEAWGPVSVGDVRDRLDDAAGE